MLQDTVHSTSLLLWKVSHCIRMMFCDLLVRFSSVGLKEANYNPEKWFSAEALNVERKAKHIKDQI